ncbi:MAG TPA: GNAT family N-acetyltransferase [Dokdonella sp.]|uniref:GNAT family N-acetyltransferase n=1 Tax=Dokdonella sp. TaxID=2291710 RepID=UPI0025C35ECD|nr:GNAT family N-acetyltransferase [Dokdonella sp.]MBX3691254.1 GNAT family N-acetyltransferase [Dokdonella sp.]HNR91441.1 GNAT family N-acetyltransferase [Dokdonella sp.]
MSLVIRRGLPADAAALAAFAERTFVETFAAYNTAENMRVYLAQAFGEDHQARDLADADTTILLATRGETLVAYAQMQRSAVPDGVDTRSAIELKRFYVDRSAHGRGVAAELMAAVFATARSHDAEHVWLGVWEHNPRAIAFYRRTGFIDVGTKCFPLGDDLQIDRIMCMAVPR